MPIAIIYKRKFTPPIPQRSLSLRIKPLPRHKPYGSRAPLANNFWGNLICTLRIEQGKTQREICIACNIQSRTLRKFEEGRALPYIDVIENILGVLGYELEALNKTSIEVRYRREEMLRQSRRANDGARDQLGA